MGLHFMLDRFICIVYIADMHKRKTTKSVTISFRTAPEIRGKLAQDAARADHDNISIVARAIVERHYRNQKDRAR
jgi:hypothetical protein